MAPEIKLDLWNDCVMMPLDEEALVHFMPFHCGDDDLDDFFANDAIAYQTSGMGITYCWVLKAVSYTHLTLPTILRV